MPETKLEVNKADRFGEIVVEIATAKNQNVMDPITKAVLRGRWDTNARGLKGKTVHSSMANLPNIPGIHIILECGRKSARVIDPLNEPRNRELAANILQVLNNAPIRNQTDFTAEKDREQLHLSATDLKTWLYWLRRWVDTGYAELVRGNLPEMNVIEKLEGYIRMSPWDPSPAKCIPGRKEKNLI